MEIRKITVNGNEYQFINDSRNTRSGFAHDTTLFKNGREYSRATANYINRTWECYRYQTVMKRCISDIIDSGEEDFITAHKRSNNIKRLTAEKRDAVIREFYEQEITVCEKCGSENIDYHIGGGCYCHNCKSEQKSKDIYISSPYERTRASVYASGNKWAIENFNATH